MNALPKEMSIRNKLGCPNISLSINDNTPLEVFEKYEEATIKYTTRMILLKKIIKLLKQKVNYKTIVDSTYLYELWISILFDIEWNNNVEQLLNSIIFYLKYNFKEENPYHLNFLKSKEDLHLTLTTNSA